MDHSVSVAYSFLFLTVIVYPVCLSEQSKSALTDHASHENHVINWSDSTIILDRESDRGTRWIKEAVHTGKEGQRSMNRDEGSYTLSHMYDRFLATSHHYRGKTGRRIEQHLLQTKVSDTHTHTFNGPFSGTTRVSQYQKGKNQSGFY